MDLSSLTGCILYIQFLKPLLILLFFSYFNSRNFIYILLKSLVTLKVLTIIYIIGVRFEVRLNVNEKKRKFTEKKPKLFFPNPKIIGIKFSKIIFLFSNFYPQNLCWKKRKKKQISGQSQIRLTPHRHHLESILPNFFSLETKNFSVFRW